MPKKQKGPRLKIAVVATNSWYLWNFRKETLVALREAGHEVICFCGNRDYFERLSRLGVEVRNVEFGPRRVRIGTLWQTQRALRSQLDDFGPDVVLGFTLLANVHVGLWGPKASRWIAVIAGQGALAQYGALRQRLTLGLLRPMMQKASAVVFQNEVDLADWTDAGLVPPNRAHLVAGSGVDLAAWRPVHPAEGPINVLCHARLLRAKGIGHFLSLAKIAREKGLAAHFHLAGFAIPETQGGFPIAEIKAAEARGEITYHGALDDVRPLFQGRTVGCLLSEYGEGKPRSLIEALAAGCPILMSKIRGCDDLVGEANGVSVDLGSSGWRAEALAFIAALAADEDLYRTMGERSRALAQSKFDVRDNVTRLLELVEGK